MPFLKLNKKLLLVGFLILVAAGVLLVRLPLSTARADDVSDLQAQIDQRNANIAQLEKEIAQYQALADKTSAQAKTLQNAIATLQASQKKLDASIKVTQDKIAAANLDIQKLGIQITDKQQDIKTNQEVIAQALRSIQQTDSESLITSFLSRKNLGDFWNDVQNLITFQNRV